MHVDAAEHRSEDQRLGVDHPAGAHADAHIVIDEADTADTPSTSGQDPTVPIDATVPEGAQGVTAFFLFSNVHRERVKAHLQQTLAEGEKVTIGMVGKCIGALWKSCSDAVKAAYTTAAKEVRGRLCCTGAHFRLRVACAQVCSAICVRQTHLTIPAS